MELRVYADVKGALKLFLGFFAYLLAKREVVVHSSLKLRLHFTPGFCFKCHQILNTIDFSEQNPVLIIEFDFRVIAFVSVKVIRRGSFLFLRKHFWRIIITIVLCIIRIRIQKTICFFPLHAVPGK